MSRKRKVTYTVKYSGGYSLGMFIFDVIMVPLTGGLWFIWILLR